MSAPAGQLSFFASAGLPEEPAAVMVPVQETLPFEDLPEIPTASPWCQRWREGKHSWRHVRDGGFDARHYQVDVILEEEPGKGFVLAHHYSRSYPAVLERMDAERRPALYEFDLVRGLTGLGAYLLHRDPAATSSAASCPTWSGSPIRSGPVTRPV
ncbi:hypothetical protein [Streptomyces sp. SYSU K217416]